MLYDNTNVRSICFVTSFNMLQQFDKLILCAITFFNLTFIISIDEFIKLILYIKLSLIININVVLFFTLRL